MDTEIKISVIVPLYNKSAYVRRALDSIAVQMFSNFEVIVVDDGSTDGGQDIVASYPDPRFRLIRQINSGPGAARNRGAAEARGEFLAFLDADDEWLPTYLEDSLGLMEDSGSRCASVTSGYIDYPSGRSLEQMWRRRGITEGRHRLLPETVPALAVHMLAYMSPWSTIVRADVFRKWGGFYERDRCVYAEDAFLWLKVLLNETVAFSLAPLALFHREASGLSKNLKGARPIEPFLIYPEEIEASCPQHLRELLTGILAIRALKTGCVLGYWGEWRQAGRLMARFTSWRDWNLPYYLPALLCRTPLGAGLGRTWRAVVGLTRKQTEPGATSMGGS
jgi:glycosyltransferase involved in cell wall biosynthesis